MTTGHVFDRAPRRAYWVAVAPSGTPLLKAMMAGARVAMTTSALLLHGIEHLTILREGLLDWMEAREYESIRQMQGSMSYRSVGDPPRSSARTT